MYARRSERRRARDADLFAVPAASEGAATSVPSHATPLTGERNESSVLFSLATLAKQAPAPAATTVTESSSLIDIRALVSATAASKGEASTQRADDIMNLSGGGAFAPLFAPPATWPDGDAAHAMVDGGAPGRRHRMPLVIGASAFAVVVVAGVAAIASARASSSAPAVTAASAVVALGTPANVPSSAAPEPSPRPVAAASEASPAPPAPLGPASRPTARASDTRPAATQAPAVTATSATPRCCPGESDIACHMRLSAGAACSAEPSGSKVTSAQPFDRPTAARALGINVASCKRGDGPTGPGHVKVTFQPSGSVSAVDVEAPYAGTATGACVAQRYRGVSVPAFAGGPLTVGKGFAIE